LHQVVLFHASLARMALGTFNVFGGSGAWSLTERRPANRVFTYPAR
jgi:hypothetical protein